MSVSYVLCVFIPCTAFAGDYLDDQNFNKICGGIDSEQIDTDDDKEEKIRNIVKELYHLEDNNNIVINVSDYMGGMYSNSADAKISPTIRWLIE